MAEGTFATTPLFQEFVLPFLLIFALIFAVLEKTKLLGEDKKQVNAILALVVGLIFVGFVGPKIIVGDLILFMVVALVVLFVFLLLYGFVASDKEEGMEVEKWMKWVFGILIGISVIIAVAWATGSSYDLFDFLFFQPWSDAFWTNAIFVVIIAIVVAVAYKSGKSD